MAATVEGIDGAVRVGDRLRPKRSRTGRIWRVRGESREGWRVSFRLEPEGDDVGPARNERTGKWQGGVRGVWRSLAELEGWERV